jgi:anti-sigma B factor antagonist
MKLEVETEQLGPATWVVALTGEVDLYSAPDLKAELARLTDGGAHDIVVDMTGTTFIDSTALGVLVRAVQRMRETDGGRFALVVTDENIRRIFEMTGLERVFPIYGSRDEALTDSG